MYFCLKKIQEIIKIQMKTVFEDDLSRSNAWLNKLSKDTLIGTLGICLVN